VSKKKKTSNNVNVVGSDLDERMLYACILKYHSEHIVH
jgi:hypothetical protein